MISINFVFGVFLCSFRLLSQSGTDSLGGFEPGNAPLKYAHASVTMRSKG